MKRELYWVRTRMGNKLHAGYRDGYSHYTQVYRAICQDAIAHRATREKSGDLDVCGRCAPTVASEKVQWLEDTEGVGR